MRRYRPGASTGRSVVTMAKIPPGIPRRDRARNHPDFTTARIKVRGRPDTRVRGQWHRDPLLRLDVVFGQGKIANMVAVGGAIDVRARGDGASAVDHGAWTNAKLAERTGIPEFPLLLLGGACLVLGYWFLVTSHPSWPEGASHRPDVGRCAGCGWPSVGVVALCRFGGGGKVEWVSARITGLDAPVPTSEDVRLALGERGRIV